jgi:hypothetical protein
MAAGNEARGGHLAEKKTVFAFRTKGVYFHLTAALGCQLTALSQGINRKIENNIFQF